ncbi:MAG: Gldg family protein [Desulfosarcinaceae bacterium]
MKIQRYFKFLLYIVVVVLVSLAGRSLFFRVDLTKNHIYSLSPVSRQVVSSLREPLTIKVFFTENLPAPHNGTELYLRDLLKEYALYGNKYFNYHFYNVSPETEAIGDDARANREMARDYGINPVQIQLIDKDEVKFKQAYMGLVLIHGDIIERIPTLTSTNGLEYKLTTAIQKLNNKVSALLKLDEKVRVRLVLSSSIYKVAPYMGIEELQQYPQKIKEVVERLNPKVYNKLSFERIDPSVDQAAEKTLGQNQLMKLSWPAIPKANVSPGQGTIGILMQYKDKVREIPILHVIRLPIFGTRYKLEEIDALEEIINANLERLVNINEDLGYLADFGTLETQGLGPMGPRGGDTLNRFNALVGENYNLKPVSLKDGTVPEGLKCLVIARPTQPLSDYALYQIDQALMHGTNLAIFVDAFKEVQPQGQQPFMNAQMPQMVPLDTGLGKLLDHYGVRIKKSIVLDENCYKQRQARGMGGGEQPIYFAPIIQSQHMNKNLDFIKNIKGLIALKISPLELAKDRIKAQGIMAHELFASSDKSWEIRDRINLNPMFLRPPASDSEMSSQPLAYLLEGSFSSYFKDKPMPEKPVEKDAADAENKDKAADKPAVDLSGISGQGDFRAQSPPAKVLVIASSEFLKDTLLDDDGQSTNSMFVLNVIDSLNNREPLAAMRSKIQQFNPLAETGAGMRALIKWSNIVGLPILVVIFGLLVWMRRNARRRRIQQMFLR